MNNKGVTLIELLVVLVVMGIIAVIAVPAVGRILDNARSDAIELEADAVENGLRLCILSEDNKIDCNYMVTLSEYVDIKDNYTYSVEVDENGDYKLEVTSNGKTATRTSARTITD